MKPVVGSYTMTFIIKLVGSVLSSASSRLRSAAMERTSCTMNGLAIVVDFSITNADNDRMTASNVVVVVEPVGR